MYTQFYSLSKMPFDMTPDPEFHFPSELHREALASVIYGLVNYKGIVSLIGEVGTGKTITLRTLAKSPMLNNFKIVFFFNPALTPEDLLKSLMTELDIKPNVSWTINEKYEAIAMKAVDLSSQGQSLLVIIDEAQHTSDETLEKVRLLSNVETDNRKLIQILLSGQPELLKKLQKQNLRQLRQRIAVSAQLKPMTYEQTGRYIAYRMWQAGAKRLPFYSDAYRQIIESTDGNPRLVNIVCDLCLATGMGYNKDWIDLHIVNEVIDDLKDTALAGVNLGQNLLDRRQCVENQNSEDSNEEDR